VPYFSSHIIEFKNAFYVHLACWSASPNNITYCGHALTHGLYFVQFTTDIRALSRKDAFFTYNGLRVEVAESRQGPLLVKDLSSSTLTVEE